jgi:HAD superfamily hydrolase (TIGR01509 family)
VLFDLDGTLTDTFELWYQAVRALLGRHLGTDLDREDYRQKWWGMDGRGKARGLLGSKEDQVEQHYTELVDLLMEKAPLVRPLPGRAEALEALSSRLPLAVISNGPMRFLEAQLRQVGFDRYFAVRIADAEPKPAPDGILRACAELKVKPAEALFVGDSRFDSEAAANAGSPVLIVREDERLDERMTLEIGAL